MYAVFLKSDISDLCNIPDLVISIKLLTGAGGGSAVVLIFYFLNTGLLSVQHTDSLQYVLVFTLSFPCILSTVHVLSGFASLSITVVSKLFKYNTFGPILFWMVSMLRIYLKKKKKIREARRLSAVQAVMGHTSKETKITGISSLFYCVGIVQVTQFHQEK